MKQQDVCIIGLGRFGQSVLNTLTSMGKNVVVVEEDKSVLNKHGTKASLAACFDSTDEQALLELGVDRMDTVIIAIGEDVEASVITASALKDIGVKNIIAKATSQRHEQILRKIGVTSIVRPEVDAGRRAAERAIYGHALDTTVINGYNSLVKVKVSNEKITQKPLSELHFRRDNGINVVSITRDGVLIIPNAQEQLKMGDDVIVIGSNDAITKIEGIFGVSSK